MKLVENIENALWAEFSFLCIRIAVFIRYIRKSL